MNIYSYFPVCLQEVRNATEIVGDEVSFADQCSTPQPVIQSTATLGAALKNTQRTFFCYYDRGSTKLHTLKSTARRSPTFARKSDRNHRKNESYMSREGGE
jgi:hypothetical protein